VIAAARTHRNSARWPVALAGELRRWEALGLRRADVDLERVR
jgi:integrase